MWHIMSFSTRRGLVSISSIGHNAGSRRSIWAQGTYTPPPPSSSTSTTATTQKTQMNAGQLIEMVAREHEVTNAKAKRIVDSVFDTIMESVKDGNRVTIKGFGSFRPTHRSAREVTGFGGVWHVPEQKAIRFKPSKNFRRFLN